VYLLNLISQLNLKAIMVSTSQITFSEKEKEQIALEWDRGPTKEGFSII
jgi:hypothetical protein